MANFTMIRETSERATQPTTGSRKAFTQPLFPLLNIMAQQNNEWHTNKLYNENKSKMRDFTTYQKHPGRGSFNKSITRQDQRAYNEHWGKNTSQVKKNLYLLHSKYLHITLNYNAFFSCLNVSYVEFYAEDNYYILNDFFFHFFPCRYAVGFNSERMRKCLE